MRQKIKVAGLGFGMALAALGWGLSACNLQEEGPHSSEISGGRQVDADHPLSREAALAFEREMLDVKARETDPERREAAMRALTERYRFAKAEPQGVPLLNDAGSVDPAVLAAEARGKGAAAPVPAAEPADAGAQAPAFGKVAAAAATRWYMAKSISFGDARGYKRSRLVHPGETFRIWTTHDPAVSQADPMLLAFIDPFQDVSWPNVPFQLVGASDDEGGGLDADLSWLNSTGKDQIITYVAHAYTRSNQGMGTLNTSCRDKFGRDCLGFTGLPLFFGGIAVRSNTESTAAGCVGPTKSNISLSIRQGGLLAPMAMAVNKAKMRGGETDGGPTVLLADILTNNGSNYLVAFTLQTDNSVAGDFFAFQGNNYTCP